MRRYGFRAGLAFALTLLFLAPGLFLLQGNIAQAQSAGVITIEDADSVREATTAGPPRELIDLLVQVPPRIAIEYANSVRHRDSTALPTQLSGKLAEVPPRIAFEYANSTYFRDVQLTPAELDAKLALVPPRIAIEHPNSTYHRMLVQIPPALSDLLDQVAARIAIEGANSTMAKNLVSLADLPEPPVPEGVSDLRARAGDTLGSFILEWTAPGPERASSYDIRYSRNSITEGNWASATPVPGGPPAPKPPGAPESLRIPELPTGPLKARYHFALKSSIPGVGASPLSNVPVTLTCKRAVVLVHGWRSSAKGAWGDGGLDFAAALEGDGFCVHSSLDLKPSNGDIKELAEQLRQKVDEILADRAGDPLTQAGYSSVDLVTHSMGGLVSRYYTRHIDSGKVNSIIMLGTPNHGTTLFSITEGFCIFAVVADPQNPLDAIKECLGNAKPVKGIAGEQMEATYSRRFFLFERYRESLFLQDLNRAGLPNGVFHWTIAGTNALFGPLGSQWLALSGRLVSPNPDDGMVSARSVCLSGQEAHYRYSLNHFGLHESEDVKELVAKILKESPPTGTSCVPATGAPGILGVEETNAISQVAAAVSGALAPGAEQRHTVPLESGIAGALFFALVSDPAVRFSLQTPSVTIDPTSPDYSEDVGGLLKMYELANPVPGDWELVFSSPESAPGPAIYQAAVLVEAQLALGVDMPTNIYIPGETVQITARLQADGEPISGATAIALITDPLEAASSLPLVDGGDGSYGLSYAPSDPGRYEVQVRVEGELPGGGFVRQVTFPFWVVGGAPLSGTVLLEGRSDHYGARITLEPGGLTTLSASDGSFAFLRVPDGSYKIEISAPGYISVVLDYTAVPKVEADVLPTVTLLAGPPCGDQNGDGEVNVLDVAIDLQIAVGAIEPTDIQLFFSDLNRDGDVNVLDAIMGLQHIVGLIPSLEPCGPG